VIDIILRLSFLIKAAFRNHLAFAIRRDHSSLVKSRAGLHPIVRRSQMSTDSASVSPTASDREARRIEARWNRLADSMDRFHAYFRMEFERIYELADGSFHELRMTLPMYLKEVDGLKRHLEAHHTIEERFIFPILANRMPAFAENEQHRKSHDGIHEGLDRLSLLTNSYRANPPSYSPEKMRECLDSFRNVLMRHLDEEVADLGAENMKKYWTLQEVDSFMM